MKLLHIDSSISGGQSVSRQLTASIVARLKQTTPGLEITYRDLAISPVPHQSPTILFAKMKALYEAGALAGHIVEMVAAAVQSGAKVDASTQAEFAENQRRARRVPRGQHRRARRPDVQFRDSQPVKGLD